MTKNVVEVIYGKYSKFEVVKVPGGLFSSPSFSIYKDGSYHRGSFSSLSAAVEAAKREG
jgi:hypothetical protein